MAMPSAYPKQIRQCEVLAGGTLFVVEAGFSRRDETAPGFNESTDRTNGLVRQRTDVREDKHIDGWECLIQLVDVDRTVVDPLPEEYLENAIVRVLRFNHAVIAAVVVETALRPQHTNIGHRAPIHQVLLGVLVPRPQRRRRLILARVLMLCPDMMPPGKDPPGNAGDGPHASFGLGSARYPKR